MSANEEAAVAGAMERLHGNFHSFALREGSNGRSKKTCRYLFLRDGEPQIVLLYRLQGRTLHVLNEDITLGAHEIAVFAEHALERHARVGAIRMHSIDTDLALLRMPLVKVQSSELMVLALPTDRQSYWSSLDLATRRSIKSARQLLTLEQGKISLLIQEGEDITRAAFDEVLAMIPAGVQAAHKSEKYWEQIWHSTREHGLVLRLTVNGRTAAGALCLRSADHWRLCTVGHDPALHHDDLNALCCYLSIQECIRRGGSEFHFPSEPDACAARLLARERKLYDLTIYRSRSHMALQPFAVLVAWWRRVRRPARSWSSSDH